MADMTRNTQSASQLAYTVYKQVAQGLSWACEGFTPSTTGQVVESVEAEGGLTQHRLGQISISAMNFVAIGETEPLFIARSSERHRAESQVFTTTGAKVDAALKQVWQGAACELLITNAQQSWVITVNECGGIGFMKSATKG